MFCDLEKWRTNGRAETDAVLTKLVVTGHGLPKEIGSSDLLSGQINQLISWLSGAASYLSNKLVSEKMLNYSPRQVATRKLGSSPQLGLTLAPGHTPRHNSVMAELRGCSSFLIQE